MGILQKIKISRLLNRLAALRWLAEVFALLGGLAYFLQARLQIAILPSILDEGNYLYKGWLFAAGQYFPYQDYGPWTNKMPFGFLLQGWVQAIFSPGLRTGRWLAIALGLLMLLGLYLVARRMGSRWWGAAAVWMVAANPGLIGMYSQAYSEGLVACLLVWTLVFGLGSRPNWKLGVAGLLAGLTLVTRENMLPWAGLFLLYILWQNGWRGLAWAGIPFLVPVAAVHILFWPNILRLWAAWLPVGLTPFLDFVRVDLGDGMRVWGVGTDFLSRLFSFFESFRFHFIALVGGLATLVFWPRRSDWRRPDDFKAAVFLAVSLLALSAVHAWAALGHDYCIYCYAMYLSFFIPIGFLLLVLSACAWRLRLPPLRHAAAVLLLNLLTTGLGFALHQELETEILNLQVPRMRGLQLLPGTTDLWRLLSNKFALPYETLKQLLPTLAGFLLGLLLLALVGVAFIIVKRKPRVSWGAASLMVFFLVGAGLTPSVLLGGANPAVDCGGDVIASYEAAGAVLRQAVPSGAQVDWRGGLSPAPLLYMDSPIIYPPQLNDGYSRIQGGDADTLLRGGLWNEQLSDQWLRSTDYLLAEKKVLKNLKTTLDGIGYRQVAETPPIITCRDNSPIYVLKRQP